MELSFKAKAEGWLLVTAAIGKHNRQNGVNFKRRWEGKFVYDAQQQENHFCNFMEKGVAVWGCGRFLGLFKLPNQGLAYTPMDASVIAKMDAIKVFLRNVENKNAG
jgi:hypothetical protein